MAKYDISRDLVAKKRVIYAQWFVARTLRRQRNSGSACVTEKIHEFGLEAGESSVEIYHRMRANVRSSGSRRVHSVSLSSRFLSLFICSEREKAAARPPSSCVSTTPTFIFTNSREFLSLFTLSYIYIVFDRKIHTLKRWNLEEISKRLLLDAEPFSFFPSVVFFSFLFFLLLSNKSTTRLFVSVLLSLRRLKCLGKFPGYFSFKRVRKNKEENKKDFFFCF